MIDETKAANSGGAQPVSFDSSVWMKTRPVKGCFSRSTGPCMCTPQPLQAWRRISAFGSTTLSLSALRVTCTLALGTTATCENSAPLGFQHLVHPHTWLYWHCALMTTSTG